MSPVLRTVTLASRRTTTPVRILGVLKDAALMEAYAVSRAVNSVSVKNDTEECIEPLPEESGNLMSREAACVFAANLLARICSVQRSRRRRPN
jgi:hypothetical protein